MRIYEVWLATPSHCMKRSWCLPLNEDDETKARVPDGTALTLHGWDFGGQKVYRVTHQFFYSRRTLYLIVWNARGTAEKCDVVGWLERLRLRVGSEARVLIVCTQCDVDDRVARIDRHRLRQQYGDLIPEDGFIEVHSETKTGIDELRTLIARETAAARTRQPKRWGNLRRVFDKSSGDHLWLCHEHRLVLNSALPVLQKPSDEKTT